MKAALFLILTLILSTSGVGAQSAGARPAFDDQIDTVDVTAPKIPLDKAINNFVKVYAAPSVKADKIPKWASGICPITEGLTPVENAGISAYVKLIAAQVGAPLVTKDHCDTNVEIVFTHTPQDVLDDIAKNHEDLLGYHDVSQTKKVATMSHPVQAWYATATRDNNGILRLDSAQDKPECTGANDELNASFPTGPPSNGPAYLAYLIDLQQVSRYCGWMAVTGSRAADGLRGEFSYVTILVDVDKLGDLGIKPVTNYIAMLTLSQTQNFEKCQPLASITNLMTSECDPTLKSSTLSVNDVAYLKALYKMNPNIMLAGQQSSITHEMETELRAH